MDRSVNIDSALSNAELLNGSAQRAKYFRDDGAAGRRGIFPDGVLFLADHEVQAIVSFR
jgi:hypothetical protein